MNHGSIFLDGVDEGCAVCRSSRQRKVFPQPSRVRNKERPCIPCRVISVCYFKIRELGIGTDGLKPAVYGILFLATDTAARRHTSYDSQVHLLQQVVDIQATLPK